MTDWKDIVFGIGTIYIFLSQITLIVLGSLYVGELGGLRESKTYSSPSLSQIKIDWTTQPLT